MECPEEPHLLSNTSQRVTGISKHQNGFSSNPELEQAAPLFLLGTLTSITNLATSLARNMDRLSLDEEHYTRQEEWRRQLPESLGDGLRQGLSRLGISLLGV